MFRARLPTRRRAQTIITTLFTLLAGVLACSHLVADDRYTARFSDDLRTVESQLCFDGPAPDRLYRHSLAAQYASPLRYGDEVLVNSQDDHLRLPALPENSCVQWTFDLGTAADEGKSRSALRVDGSVLALTNLWFWKGPWRRPLIARIELPEGMNFSSPWPPDPENPGWYRPERTPSGWYARSAVGRFHTSTIQLPGGTVDLAVLGDLDDAQVDKLDGWIRTTLDAVVPVFGYFPREHVQVVVVPLGPSREAVPWAHVVRGGGPAVQLYVDETRPLEELNRDWTATHEFSHLLLPYVSRSDRWLSEGLASYYQNVLRARDGRLSQQEAWQKLHEGFGRGQRATRQETLREATRGGWENVMRIYWSGAAMMLEADMALREETGGQQTLDSALQQLNDCCLEDGKRWSGRELLDRLDQLTGSNVFGAVFDEHVDSMSFPDLEERYDALGLVERDGQIRLSGQAPLVEIRNGIMRGAPAGNSVYPAWDDAP